MPTTVTVDVADVEYEALDEDVSIATKKTNKVKLANDIYADNNHAYNIFPNDIWFLISEYIRPEDVMRFALICKQTYAITTTLKFWKNLYRRCYRTNVELPVRLQLDCMARPRGTRACAIRSLFFTYPPFVEQERLQSQQDFHSLIRHRVVQFWFQQVSVDKFQYFFKLKRKLMPGSRSYESEQLQRKNGRSLKALRDVYCNSEESCKLLMVRKRVEFSRPTWEVYIYLMIFFMF